MDYIAEKRDGVQVVRIQTDRMTHEMLDAFRDQVLGMIEGGDRHVLLDMREVNYLDSFGVGVIMEIYRRLRSLNGSLKLSGLQSRVSKMVAITNLDSVLEIFEEEAAALRSFTAD